MIDTCRNSTVGIGVYNRRDRYPQDRALWDAVNKLRDYDDLVWGFAFDDMHSRSHIFRNYNHHFMYDLTEEELRRALKEGTSTFSHEPGGSGDALAPRLISIDIDGPLITVEGENYTKILWYDDNTNVLTGSFISSDNKTIDVAGLESGFVRVVLENNYGRTYVQPFGYTFDSPSE